MEKFSDFINRNDITNIDDVYEDYINRINISDSSDLILDYYVRFYNESIDNRLTERIINNYNNLISIYNSKLYEDNNVDVDVTSIDNPFIDELINEFTFISKKRKDKNISPIKITGDTGDNIRLNITLSNKDNIILSFCDNVLKVKINDKLVYDMDDIQKNTISGIVYTLYKKQLEKQGYKIIKKINPFK